MDRDTCQDLDIVVTDAQGEQALALLREAAIEARALYPEQVSPDTPWPGNPPTPPRGVYLLACRAGTPIGMAALQPIDATAAEIRRMYVLKPFRRIGVARMLLIELERWARQFDYSIMRLETGERQLPAMRLYEACGFERIAAFGPYTDDPTSICYEKALDKLLA